MKKARKFLVAAGGAACLVLNALAVTDPGSKAGQISNAVIGLLTALGVYVVPNAKT